MNLTCVKCKAALSPTNKNKGKFQCDECGFEYIWKDNCFKYIADPLLFEHFRRDYLLNKALNNNGYISYQVLSEGSLSYKDRNDVSRFRSFINSQIKQGKILDIGCGLLPLPGYLDFDHPDQYELIGLDPIDDETFRGFRIVGCAEYTPFEQNSLDGVIFATSLDHVVSMKASFNECYRVLDSGGKLLIWMTDISKPFWQNIKWKWERFKESIRQGYPLSRYVVYPNWTVFYIPGNAVDPFHKCYEKPREVVKLLNKTGFKKIELVRHSEMEIFVTAEKNV